MTAPLRPEPPDTLEAADPAVLAQVVDLLADCREVTLTLAIFALQWSAAPTPQERERFARQFREARGVYIDRISEKTRIAPFMKTIPDVRIARIAVHDFFDQLVAMEENQTEMPPERAAEIADRTRLKVYPALREIIAYLEQQAREQEHQRQACMAEKADLVDRILRDMGRIGRMIGSISINASVEAARAGGDSGRAFQVIAAEVRDLARQSATLLEEMKERLADRPR